MSASPVLVFSKRPAEMVQLVVIEAPSPGRSRTHLDRFRARWFPDGADGSVSASPAQRGRNLRLVDFLRDSKDRKKYE